MVRSSKDTYYKKYFEDNIKNSLKIWSGIKELINIKGNKKSSPKSLSINGKLITDNKEVATEFNKFFSTIASNIDSKIIPTNYQFYNALINPNENSIL